MDQYLTPGIGGVDSLLEDRRACSERTVCVFLSSEKSMILAKYSFTIFFPFRNLESTGEIEILVERILFPTEIIAQSD